VAMPALSVALVVAGLYGQRLAGRFAAKAERTRGVVVSVRSERRGEHGRAHFPTVRFRLPGGREVETEVSRWFATSYTPPLRSPVTVLYDPEDPYDVGIGDAVEGNRSWFIVLALLGVVLAPFGLWFFLIGFDPAALKDMVGDLW